MSVADTAPFTCDKCGEPLSSLAEERSQSKRLVAFLLQGALILVGGGVITYKLLSGGDDASVPPPVAAPIAARTAAVNPAVPTLSVTQPAVTAPANPAPAIPAPRPVVAVPPPTPQAAETQMAAASQNDPRGPETTLLRLAGSDVIGARIARRLASGYLAFIGDTNIAVTPGTADGLVQVGGLQAGEREVVSIASSNTATGLQALLRGKADFAMAARKINAAEVDRMSPLGDMTSPASEQVIAVQGIAVVISPSNRLSAVTLAQLRNILSGRVRDWAEVGGVPGPVRVVALDSRNGTIDTPSDVIAGLDGSYASTRVATDEAVVAAVLNDPAAIGLAPLKTASNARILAVADGGEPVSPNELTISTEGYPLTRRLYLYSAATGQNTVVRRFTDYISSPSGQAAVEAAGFTPLTVRAEATAVPVGASDRLRQLISGATRVSVDFRFQPGGVEIDNRGLRDLERLTAYIRAQRVNPARLILAGFADNSGTPQANLSVSQRRVEAVNAALARLGITPGKTGAFGSDLPVGDNSTLDGRERNRRVEVYVSP